MTDKQIIIDKYPDCEYYNFSLGGICDQTTLSGNGKNCAKCSDINGCFIKEHYKQFKRKEQECQQTMDNYVQLDLQRVKEYNELVDLYKAKEQECEKLKTQILLLQTMEIEELKNYKQSLDEIKEIAEPYKMIIKKICGNCKKYDDCHACCYKDINCYKYTSPKTNACEEFTYLDKFVPNILSNSILQKISEAEDDRN